MEKNYYEVLQVSKNASSEIIEKAYKTLVKKYHPDLQDNSEKNNYEEIIKNINEAYETLSNPEKRNIYDQNTKKTEISINDYNNLYNENISLKKELNYLKNISLNNNFNNELNNATIKAYYDAYIQDLKNRGYKIKYKKTWKDFLAFILTFFVILIIGFILWHIPFTKNYFINLYNENSIIKSIIDTLFS